MTTVGPGSAPAPVEAPREAPHHDGEPESALEPLYHLVLLDDDHHTYAYVIEMLGKIFGYGREKSYALASIVDSAGRVVVETADHDRVTLDQGKIHGHGADPRIPASKGSMSAIVEAAERA